MGRRAKRRARTSARAAASAASAAGESTTGPAPSLGGEGPGWLTPTVARAALLGIVALFALVTLPFLMTYPPVDNVGDEAWVMSISQELWRTGRPVAAIHAGT